MDVSRKVLVTGGIKSGKSRIALDRALQITGDKVFLATAQALDDVMKQKIEAHQKERGASFVTVEEPVFLSKALNDLKASDVILIDCLTVWINNLFYHFTDIEKIHEQQKLFLNVLQSTQAHVIIVTNEVGLGVTPDNQLSRAYIDELGLLNQEVAKVCDEVIMVVSGLPQTIKGRSAYAKVE